MSTTCAYLRSLKGKHSCACKDVAGNACMPMDTKTDLSACPSFAPRRVKGAVVQAAQTPQTPRTISATKPRLSIDELAAKRKRCQEAKQAGKPCVEFAQPEPMQLPAVANETLVNPVPRHDRRDAFNASLFRRANGQLLMAYRTGQGGSNIHVCPMSEDLQPGRSTQLGLAHDHCPSSREDPRLFEHRGRLHVTFVGVIGDPGNGNPGSTHVLYAELTDDFRVKEIHHPIYDKANAKWEKSHGYFSWQNELFAVYSIKPHVVLHIRGDEALPFSEHVMPMPWTGWHLRGGASPILIGDEYWSWFHGSVEKGQPTPSGPAGTKVYNVGVYAFEAKPPFRPTRITPSPVLWADESTRLPAWCAVVFCCGAVLDGERWRISAGVHDREIRVYEFNHRDIEKAMVSL